MTEPGKPPKILFVSTLYYPHHVGGAEATVRMLAEAAAARGQEVVVVTLAPDGREAEDVVNGVKVVYLPLANLFFLHGPGRKPRWLRPLWHLIDAWNPVMARRLGRVLDREKPDVVNLHNVQGFSVAAWGAVARRGIPVVQTLHDYYTGCANSSMFRHGRNCERPCAACVALGTPRRRLSRHAAVVTTVSRRLFERIRAAGVYAGVGDVRVIHNCNAGEAQVPREPPRPGRPLRFGFLGRLEPVKGLELLLDTVASLPDGRAVAIVGGTGAPEYEAAVRGRYEGPGVRFLGWVDPPRFFQEIDVLVVPSIWEEPLSRVSHEAMGYGVPVVGARTGGIPEIVRDGDTGFLFKAGDADDLARVLRGLIEAPPDWAALSERCRSHAESFRLEPVFESYRAAWEDAATRRAPRRAA
ncbi:glycosyltransferase family 4 protein [Azospirillum sp. RWY-5-1]|uniref:Glycosyltransferase family 4 protein n=1 Tax=Azospirillum oleiclasticum TaxID=2735135 RepID=A0ABX2TIH2_9PROT|nr:glycosyltransferase family 4 protein [Azospirillum oleiclasticum]NYZ16659.1 glycosyltransferase family 4 protein [Azospirillum oleiclasticum]NYZ24146.1 glycosyltransferase family 4 protein [Azospirillum oleiclasticum]